MSLYSKTLVQISAILIALTATPKLLSVSLSGNAVLAQSSNPDAVFPLPESLPSGTTIKVDGSSSMSVINQALKKRFEEKFPNSQIELSAAGSDQAIDALLNAEVDVVGIGRPLTAEEKAAGLVAVSVDRPKIAIIVGQDNPFNENLTFEQFAQIFRGEITDWSEVGGEPGPIRFVDRPNFSDTRRSLGTYEVFQSAPFETGATATPVSEDETAAVVQELGNDGIGYAIADQVIDQPGVRIISMHQTLPDNPAYPYSQPRSYVYRQESASEPGTSAFLGFATSEPGQEIVAEAKEEEAEAVSAAIATAPGSEAESPTSGNAATPGTTPGVANAPGTAPDGSQTTATAPGSEAGSPTPGVVPAPGTTTDGGAASNSPTSETAQVAPVSPDEEDTAGSFPWWLLLLLGIPLLGWLMWGLLKGGRDEPVAGGTAGTVGTDTPTSRTPGGAVAPGADVTPTTPDIPAGGTVAPGASVTPTTPDIPAGGTVTPGADLTPTTPDIAAGGAVTPGADLTPTTPDIAAGGAVTPGADLTPTTPDIAAGGAVTPGADLTPTTPTTPGVNARTPGINLPTPPLWAGLIGVPAILAWLGRPSDSRITLTPGSHQNGSAYWTVPQADKDAAKQQGGQQYQLRICDVTDIDTDTEEPHSVQVYDCAESEREYQMPLEEGREYLAEIGYLTNDGRWLGLASSNRVSIPAGEGVEPVITGIGEGITDQVDLDGAAAPGMNGMAETIAPEQESLTDDIEATEDGVEPIPTEAEDGMIDHQVTIDQPQIPLTEEVADTVEPEQVRPTDDVQATEDEGEPRRPLWSIPILAGSVGIIGSAISALGSSTSEITLTPTSTQNAVASWQVPQGDKDAAVQQGGQQYQLRIYDVSDVDLDIDPPHSVQPYDCDESTEQLEVSLDDNRYYLAEIGYLTNDQRWLILARSNPVWIGEVDTTEDGGEPPLTDEGVSPAVGIAQPETEAVDTTEDEVEPLTTEDDEGITTPIGIQDPETSDIETAEEATQPSIPLWSIPVIGGGVGIIGGFLSTPTASTSEITLTPTGSQNAVASWQVPQGDKDAAVQQGGQQYQLRIYDVSDVDLDIDPPHSVQPYDCDESTEQLEVSLDDNRYYLAEIGYLTNDQRWLILARSNPVWIGEVDTTEDGGEPLTIDEGITTPIGIQDPETSDSETAEEATQPSIPLWSIPVIGGGVGIIGGFLSTPTASTSEITLTPTSTQNAVASWQVPQGDKDAAVQQGGQQYQLRIYDVSDVDLDIDPPHSVQPYDCDESTEQLEVSLDDNRYYLAEIGYLTNDQRWLILARSNPVWIGEVDTTEDGGEPPLTDEGVSPAVGIAQPETEAVDTTEDEVEPLTTEDDEGITTPIGIQDPETSDIETAEEATQPSIPLWSIPVIGGGVGIIGGFLSTPTASTSEITLTPTGSQNAVASWQVPQGDKDAAVQQGGQQYQLRIYDVSDVDLDIDPPHSVQPYDCDESTEQLEVSLDDNRYYLAEIGYLTNDQRWLILARSNPVWIGEVEATEDGGEPLTIDEGVSPAVGIAQPETEAVDTTEDEVEPLTTEDDEGITTPIGIQDPETSDSETAEEATQPSIPLWSIPVIGGGVGIIGGFLSTPTASTSEITLTPTSTQNAVASWQVPQGDKDAAVQQGGQQYQLRIYDVSDVDLDIDAPHSVQPYDCDESTEQLEVSLDDNRYYLAEIGYLTNDQRWLILARSNPVWIGEVDTTEDGGEPLTIDEGITTPIGIQDPETSDSETAEEATQPSIPLWSIPVIGGGVGIIGGFLSTPTASTSEITLTPTSTQNAVASWQVPQGDKDAAVQQGGQQYQLRIYDVSDVDLDIDPPHSVQPYDCDESTEQLEVSLDDNRYYLAEIGYLTNDQRWLILARSNPVWIGEVEATEDGVEPPLTDEGVSPAVGIAQPETEAVDTTEDEVEPTIDTDGGITPPVGIQQPETDAVEEVTDEDNQDSEESSPTGEAFIPGSGVIPLLVSPLASTQSQIELTPADSQNAHVFWQVPQADHDAALQQGGQQYQLRIYDVSDVDIAIEAPHSVQSYDCLESTEQLQVSLDDNRYYIAEIGYLTNDSRWLVLARSNPVLMGTVEAGASSLPLTIIPALPLTASSLQLSPGDSQNIYVSCEVPQADKDAAKQRGGQQYQLRLYDVTGIDFDTEVPHSVQPYECDESDQMWKLPIGTGNREYLVEIGYVTPEGLWLMLARSNPLSIAGTDLEDSSVGSGEDSGSQTSDQPETTGTAISRVTRGNCAIQHLSVHSRNNCYSLNDERMKQLQEVAVSKTLEAGVHIVRIKSGAFCFGSNLTPSGEPFVMLWIYGGKVINKKTNIPVTATWSTLNGYNDTLTLKVLETATLCAFFFDSYPDDNEGELTLSVARLYTD